MNIYEGLGVIQAKLKAPKNQTNSFGGYKYRSCEDILEAVKPILRDTGLVLTLTDRMVECGGRVYVEATAALYGNDDTSPIYVTAYAREEESKKGMDSSQVTGAASSYARKYALNGLFCIDDAKDSDATNIGDEQRPRPIQQTLETPEAPRAVCEVCGKPLNDRERDYSMKYYNRHLCRQHQKE